LKKQLFTKINKIFEKFEYFFVFCISLLKIITIKSYEQQVGSILMCMLSDELHLGGGVHLFNSNAPSSQVALRKKKK